MTVLFRNRDKLLSDAQVLAVEEQLRLTFPAPLRNLFLENNGGVPEPYVFQGDFIVAVVNETLPLLSDSGRLTGKVAYQNLVIDKCLTPKTHFPFAIDPGGDFFFVDCARPTAPVYFFRSDSISQSGNRLQSLGVSLNEFWESLVPEDS